MGWLLFWGFVAFVVLALAMYGFAGLLESLLREEE